MLPDALARARDLLESVTPLSTDCGRLCGGRCCRSADGEETGMLLFPGEAAYYRDRPGYTLRNTAHGTLVVCSGQCERADRPLSCRLFPLLPLLREDGVKVALDLRAAPVCPLFDMGRGALKADFIETVRAAGQLLAQDDTQRPFLIQLTRMHDDLRALRRRFGGR